jgi:hypothetical protein
MKKISNNLAMTALKTAVAISGIMCTAVASLFTSSIYGFLVVSMVGTGITCLIIECMES